MGRFMLARRAMVLAVVSASLLLGGSAYAQGESQKENAAKVLRLVKDANDEFDRGEYDDALALYQEAYGLYPDSVLLYRIALSAEKAGNTRLAIESYQGFVDAAKSDDATAQKVKERIAELKATLPPRVTVTSNPPGATVKSGGQVLGETPNEFDLQAGNVELTISLKGYDDQTMNLALENGGTETVAVTLVETAVANPTPIEPGSTSEGPSLGTYGWIATGVGVALLGTGATFAVLSSSAANDVNDYDKRAAGASREELDSLKEKADSRYSTSVAFFVAGGIVTAAGATLVVIDMLTDKPETAWIPNIGVSGDGAFVGVSTRF